MTSTLALLRERPEMAPLLKKTTEWEAVHYRDEFFRLGWSWNSFQPPIAPQTLHMLHLRGVLRQAYKSRSGTGYLTSDPAAVLKALQVFDSAQEKAEETVKSAEPPRDLFYPIVGYADLKRQITKALEAAAQVHWMFVGPPASAKTLFLLCLERLPGAGYLLGSRMSRAGLSDYLIEYRPRYLLVDEVDKLPSRDLAPLLSLCETGRVIETLYGRRREEQLSTVVFAAANVLTSLSPEFLSRFEVLQFKEYTWPQFVEICKRLLAREGVDTDLSNYISGQVWKALKTKDVREAIRISRLAKTGNEVNELIEILRKYGLNTSKGKY